MAYIDPTPKSTMQHPIIFLASQNESFKTTAIAAAIETRHLLRQAHTLEEATALLGDDTHNFALALIDADPGFHGRDLLLNLASPLPDFPVIIVDDARPDSLTSDPGTWPTVSRDVTPAELVAAIRKACDPVTV